MRCEADISALHMANEVSGLARQIIHDRLAFSWSSAVLRYRQALYLAVPRIPEAKQRRCWSVDPYLNLRLFAACVSHVFPASKWLRGFDMLERFFRSTQNHAASSQPT